MKVNLKIIKFMDEEHANTENIRKMFMRVKRKIINSMDLELIPTQTEVFLFF